MSVAHRMPDRLQELLQQRALIKEHLAWLESEIAAASGNPSAAVPAEAERAERPLTPRVLPLPARLPVTAAIRRDDDDAQILLEKLAAEDQEKKPPGKAGCWLVFAGVLTVLSLGAWALLRQFYS
jgi:hypothetical protein